ncbi:unnamed protein product [Caenorhabditis angaria]|uniref:FACT complex subunit SSRP1 n=1 Tax=Caenorhabditis angaria TaxID=860376 RepID=A0A9P1MYW0_9PELO|nr:unnamed protein product [Caenorhabditis angaria]
MTNLEFGGIFIEDMGILENGFVRFSDNGFHFKNDKTGKITNLGNSDIKRLEWQRLGNKPGVRIALQDGTVLRFGGFKDTDFDKVKEFTNLHWEKEIEQNDLMIKGWNYGTCEVKGKNIEFGWEDKRIYEIPCTNVSQVLANKNEAVLEFHQNEDAPVALMEMRFHMPVDAEDEDHDPVEEFRKAVLAFAGLETETGQAIATLPDILCTVPRGRYDIKVYPNHLSLHGKTYDYKIPIKSITRLFLVPHKDGRHVYFVISLNPPIRQGQTRYSYLVLEFIKEDDIDLELGFTDEQLKEQYGGKLQRELSGPLFEVVSKLFRVLVNMKITVPGSFIGNTGTPAVQCSHKQNPGLLYPLEKGFLFIHKPPMYVRFEEISSLHFARSDVGNVTRTFDFEIELKAGASLVFNSVEKEEYNKLYDYAQNKHIRIRNAKKMDNTVDEDRFAGSDDEIDPYKQTVKAEGRQREESDEDSEDDDYDLDEDIKKREKNKDSSEGSGSEPDDEYDSGSNSDDSGSAESEPDDEEEVPKKKNKKDKEVREKKEKKEKNDGKKKGKVEKDPNAPKRATTAYMLWFLANRVSLKEDGDSVADVAKKGGETWRKMTSDDKKEWEEKAAEDKERYEKEMKEYKSSGAAAEFAAKKKESGKSAPAKSSSSAKAKKPASGPSTSKAKSKEYISSESDSDSDAEEKKQPKKKEKKPAPKEESEESSENSSESDSD